MKTAAAQRPPRGKEVVIAVAVLVAAFVLPASVAAGFAQESGRACPPGTAPRADLGIRFRFAAGDFVDEEGRPRWVHFLSEPVVTEVDPDGPAAGRLLPGDIIVAVDDALITTRGGSLRFWFSEGEPVRVYVSRGGRPEVRWIRPLRECMPVRRP